MIHSRPASRLLRSAILAACALSFSTYLVSQTFAVALEPPIIPTVHPSVTPTSAVPVPLVVRGDHASVWRSNLEQRMLVTGRVAIDIGYRTLRADNAAIWLTPSRESGESTLDVAIYLSGHVQLAEGNHSYSTVTSGPELLVTTRISGTVQLEPTPVSRAEEDNPLVKRGDKLREDLLNAPLAPMFIARIVTIPAEAALQSGWIARGPNNRIIAGPGELKIAQGPNGNLTHPTTQPAKPRPEMIATGDLIEGGQQVGKEMVTIIHGAYLIANMRDGKPPLEFHAQRMVLFSPQQDSSATQPATTRPKGEAAQLAKQVTGAYFEGDVTVDSGNQSVRASRLYYDFASQRAIMLDATVSMVDEKRKVPLYMRAAEIRQLSRSEYAAKKATFSSSEFHTPHYAIGSSDIYLQDITPRDENGKPTGLATYAYKAKGDTIDIQGLPVFYWPYLAGDTGKNDIPLRRLRVSNSTTYGLSLQTDWDLFGLAGQKEPKGVRADLNIDYFGKRGPAGGVNATWQNDDSHGDLKSYIINDQGTDRLGADRNNIAIDQATRGRFSAQHQQDLGNGWTLSLEGSYISDPNFLEQYFIDEFDTQKEHETSAYLKKQGETDALSFLGKFSLFDFTATADKIDDQFTTEKRPEVKYWRIGDSFFDTLTYYSETGAANLHTNMTGFTPTQLGLPPSFLGPPANVVPLNMTYKQYYMSHGYRNDNVLRGDSRQEIDLPLQIGDLKVVPYLTGRATAWDAAFPEGESGNTTRLWGQAGLRSSMTFWRDYDAINSTFWDVHRIRHIIEPQFTLFETGTTESRDQLQPFDRDVEDISRASGASLSINQRWQTKRGGPGNWRNVDWIVLNIQVNQFWDKDKTSLLYPLNPLRGFFFASRPELSLVQNSVNADSVWRIGERARIIAEMSYDTDRSRLEQLATGLVVDQTNSLSYFFGNRYVQALGTDEWTVAADYQLTRKYQVIAAESYDFQLNHNILSSLTVVRKLPRFNTAITVTYDANQGDTTVVFTAWPEGFPDLGFGNRAGLAGTGKETREGPCMRIIAFFNQKGGVGKTTTTVNLGAALAQAGKKTVLIDLDPQSNLTTHVGVDPEAVVNSTYRVLTDGIPLAEALVEVEGSDGKLFVAPATTDLAAAEVELVSVVGRETLLRKMAAAAPIDADFVLIDCPPSLGLLSLNALVYASEVIVPLQAQFLALQGMEKLFDTVMMVRQALNPKLRISGILFCQFESAAKLTREVTGEVEGFVTQARGTGHPVANALIFQSHIRRNIKLAEAPSFGQSIFKYAPGSAGAADYESLVQEVLAMDGKTDKD